MFSSRKQWGIVTGLLFAVFLWGGNNVGVKFLVRTWPPVLTGSTRFLCAGMLMFALLRWTRWLGADEKISRETSRRLWTRPALSLAIYLAAFNSALRLTSASHVALYLAASPVWALMWEGTAGVSRGGLFKRYLATACAVSGVAILFLPALRAGGGSSIPGELLGLVASVFWMLYGVQCRAMAGALPGTSLTAHTMWRAGIYLLPLAVLEYCGSRVNFCDPKNLAVQLYCVIGGAVLAFALWNHGLRHMQTSEVYLFSNLIPLSTTAWAHFCLAEPITGTFWFAMLLVIAGVVVAQARWQAILGRFWFPAE